MDLSILPAAALALVGRYLHAVPPTASDTPDRICSALYERNYYAKEAAELRQPLRLHSEELTAQTDDQAERQRNFRDIIVNLGIAKSENRFRQSMPSMYSASRPPWR